MKFWDVLWLRVAVEIQLINKDIFPGTTVLNKVCVNVEQNSLTKS